MAILEVIDCLMGMRVLVLACAILVVAAIPAGTHPGFSQTLQENIHLGLTASIAQGLCLFG